MPQFKDLEKIGKLGIILENGKILDTCPVGTITNWSMLMIDEFVFSKEFGLQDDISDAQFESFKIIMNERNVIDKLKKK